jgi:hypothetical protein
MLSGCYSTKVNPLISDANFNSHRRVKFQCGTSERYLVHGDPPPDFFQLVTGVQFNVSVVKNLLRLRSLRKAFVFIHAKCPNLLKSVLIKNFVVSLYISVVTSMRKMIKNRRAWYTQLAAFPKDRPISMERRGDVDGRSFGTGFQHSPNETWFGSS